MTTLSLFDEPPPPPAPKPFSWDDGWDDVSDSAGLRYYQRTTVESCKDLLVRGVFPERFDEFNVETNGAGERFNKERPTLPLRAVLAELATGCGKCLGPGTPVLLYSGLIVRVEDVEVGDLLMGPDSKPRRVLSTTKGHGPLRRVVPIKGDPWVCNDVHVLTLVHTTTGEVVDVPMDEYEASNKNFKHLHKQFSVGVDFAGPTKAPEIDPYCVGLWLGDGNKALRDFRVSKPDSEVGLALEAVASAFGMRVVRTQYGDKCPTWHVSGDRVGRGGSELLRVMRGLFPAAPHAKIPTHYLTGSRDVRMQLLAGLLDTDGHLSGGCFEITQKQVQLADDIAYLARSLGFRVTTSTKVVEGGSYVRLIISGELSTIPTRIPRKQAAPRKQIKSALRTGFSVERLPDGDYYGFELDGDGRFLLGDFTVTHNTQVFSALAKEWKDLVPGTARVLVLCHRSELVWQAKARLEQITGEPVEVEKAELRASLRARIVVASVDTIKSKARLHRFPKDHFSLCIIDEAHHYTAETYRRPIDYFETAKVLGVTATPDRADGKALGQIFEGVAHRMNMHDAINEGFLVPVVGQEVFLDQIDISNVGTSAGELKQGELDDAMLKAAVGVCDKLLELVPDKQTIVFTPGVKTAHFIAKRLNEKKPYSAAAVDGSTPEDERKKITADFRAGRIQYLTNCNVATEGFDAPNASVVAIARPTKSRSLYAQMVGRGTRVLPGVIEDCQEQCHADLRKRLIAVSAKPSMTILDFVGNSGKHELVGPADVLGGDYTPAEIKYAKKLAKESPGGDVSQKLAQARAYLAALAKNATANVQARVVAFDPFKVFKAAEDHPNTTPAGYKPMSENQRVALERIGFTPAELEGVSSQRAQRILKENLDRRMKHLATFKQLRKLTKFGVNDAKLSFSSANAALNYIESCGWSTKRIDPAKLDAIVSRHGRKQPGDGQ